MSATTASVDNNVMAAREAMMTVPPKGFSRLLSLRRPASVAFMFRSTVHSAMLAHGKIFLLPAPSSDGQFLIRSIIW
jgi:hypothetical protein